MKHGDRVLTESTAIMEYVDNEFDGPALMATNPQRRARDQPVGVTAAGR